MQQLAFDFMGTAPMAPSPLRPGMIGKRPAKGKAASPSTGRTDVATELLPRKTALGSPVAAVGAALGLISEAPQPTPLQTLADVLACFETDAAARREHAQIRSALKMLGKVLNRPLADIPADPARLGQLLGRATPLSAGMTKARWSRVRSLTIAALRKVGIQVVPERDVGGCAPAWRALVVKLPNKALRVGTSRLLSYFTREGLKPEDVDVATFGRFHATLTTASLSQKGEKRFRSCVKYWNKAVASVADWPQVIIPLDPDPRFYALAPDSFPESLRREVQAFLAHCGNSDPLADDYALPVRPSTVAMRRKQIWQLASALVASGMPIERIASLEFLVDPTHAKLALRFLLDRKGGETTKYLGQQALLLCTLAKHKAPAHHAALRRMSSGLVVRQRGMVPRNRELLRQFQLWENLAALLNLPSRVLREVREADAGTPAGALRVMLALAVEFLTVAPMRVVNLGSLEIGRQVVEIRRGRASTRHIVIPGHQTKTGVSFEMKLPQESVALLDAYQKTYRGRISATPSDFLFPNPDGGRRSTVAFSKAISQFILRETGIVMHVHLFRHLAALLHLTAFPDDIETVRRILGHSTTAMVEKAYAEIRSDHAFRRYDAVVTGLRQKAAGLSSLRPLSRRGGARL